VQAVAVVQVRLAQVCLQEVLVVLVVLVAVIQ
jgi:hypothetical protein